MLNSNWSWPDLKFHDLNGDTCLNFKIHVEEKKRKSVLEKSVENEEF